MRRWIFVVLAFAAACAANEPRDAAPPPTSEARPLTFAPPPIAAAPSVGAEVAARQAAASDELARFSGVERAIDAAVARGDVPGAACVVVHGGRVVVRTARGLRAAGDAPEPMTIDTVFDLASLTKPLATGLAVMTLVEAGRVRLDAKVARYVPEFASNGKGDVTVEQLLLHTSGLPADTALQAFRGGRAEALRRALEAPLEAAPGERTRYSDLGFVALGALVERVAGERLDAFAQARLFGPMGLADTGFLPRPALVTRTAPTEERAFVLLRGAVHDPRAAALDGVAGHAGLFSTADDLAALGEAMVEAHRGRPADAKRSGPRGLPRGNTLRDMFRQRPVPGGARALAWDVSPSFSAAAGATAVSHTGFTGTSILVDPASETVIVLLSSRLQAGARGDAKRMRHDVNDAVRAGVRATALAASAASASAHAALQSGLDVLVAEHFARLRGKRVGLVTNAASIDSSGVSAAKRFAEGGARVVRVFTPEHGALARVEGAGDDAIEPATGAPVTRLYGAHERPTAADLEGLDAIVYDLPSVGARFFTYVTTLGLVLEAAAERGVPVVVLDRPPLVPVARVEGSLLDDELRSFTGYHRLPVAYAMTNGELARLFVAERAPRAQLSVVVMKGYDRSRAADEQGSPFAAPSPNLQRVDAALLYAGVALLERTNVSVGRGTARPFELVGAPWVDADALLRELVEERLPGARATKTSFTPAEGPFAGAACHGVEIAVVDRAELAPVAVGLALVRALLRSHPRAFHPAGALPMLGGRAAFDALVRGDTVARVTASYEPDLERFRAARARALLYP